MTLSTLAISSSKWLRIQRMRKLSFDNLSVFKEAFYMLVSIEQLSGAVLSIVRPLSFVEAIIVPIHFSVSMPKIVFVMAFVGVSRLPGIDSVSLFFVI